MSTNYSAVLGARALRSVEAQPASVEAPTPGTPRSRPDDIDSHRIGQHKTVIVGVGGASGSGKTSICEIVKAALKDDSMVTLSFDSYYIPLGGKDAATHNFDEPSALDVDLLAEHLQALKVRLQASVPKLACHTLSCAQLGKPIRVPLYDFTIHDRVGWSEPIQNPSVVFLDGIFTICCEKIRKLCDLTLFAVEDLDTCLMRRLRRDIAERGRTMESVLVQYDRFVKPGFKLFVEPSMLQADLIIPRAKMNTAAQEVLIRTIQHVMNREPMSSPVPSADVLVRKE